MTESFAQRRDRPASLPRASRAATFAALGLLALIMGPIGCGGGTAPEGTGAPLRVTIEPATVVARQNEATMVRVDVPDVPDADLPSHYAFDLDEVVGQIDVTTAPCPPGAGSRACQDWTLMPRAGSVPGTYDVNVKTVASRAGTGDGSFSLTVALAPAPAYGAAIAVSHFSAHIAARDPGGFRDAGQTLVLNERGEVFALGRNGAGQARLGYVRRDIDPRAGTAGIGEPPVVSEFVAAPLPSARWSAIQADAEHSIAVRDDGSVWVWGGPGGLVAAARPVAGLSEVRTIAAVYRSHAFVLLVDGRVLRSDLAGRTWRYCEIEGPPAAGACERGEITQLGNVRALSALDTGIGWGLDALFLKNDGSVWRHSPAEGSARQTRGLPSIEAVAISNAAVPIVLARDGTLWTLDDDNGMPIAGIDDVAAIAVRRAGAVWSSDAYALRRDGTVWWWRTDPEDRTAPQQVAGLANVAAIADGFAITGECGGGGALWFIHPSGPSGDAPSVERVPGFGEGPGCAAPPTVEIGLRVVGAGRVVSTPAALDCGSACRTAVPLGTTVTLHAAPAIGWTLSQWRGDAGCPRRGHHVTLSATSSRDCEAVFVQGGERRLSVRVAGEGRVSSTPEGIDCGADCTQSYGLTTTVALNATPARGFEFERFTGHADCDDGVLRMDAVKSCVAVFAPAVAPAAPSGFAASAGSPTSVALRWDPAGLAVERYRLERAEASGAFATIDDAIRGDASGFLDNAAQPGTTYTYRLTAINRRGESPPVTAGASTASGFVLNVSLGGTGSGSVVSVPGRISCGGDCSETFPPDSTVTLYADGHFARWVGCDSVSGSRCTVTMNRARGVDAVFDAGTPARWWLKVVKQVEGAVVSTPPGIECGLVCIADFADGAVVTLSGSTQFSGARGCDSALGRQCTVTMNRSRVVLFVGTGEPPPPAGFTLTVVVDRDGAFVGSVDGAIGCGSAGSGQQRCSASYAAGASVGLYAAPLPGANVRLEAWQGDCASFGGQPEITLTIDRDLTCRALFVSG